MRIRAQGDSAAAASTARWTMEGGGRRGMVALFIFWVSVICDTEQTLHAHTRKIHSNVVNGVNINPRYT